MKISAALPLKRQLHTYAPDWLKIFATRVDLARFFIAELLLPRKCYVQINPNSIEKLSHFPRLRSEIRSYNYATSMAQKSPPMDANRVILLRTMLRQVAALPSGDYAELGTYRGISARLILRHMKRGAQLHCFDTFEGFDDRDNPC